MASSPSTRNTSSKSRKEALSDSVATEALLHAGNGAVSEADQGNGTPLPPNGDTVMATSTPTGNGAIPEELPEDPQTPQTVRPAAAAEKFAKFTEMRHDPRASLVQTRKRLVTIPALKMPADGWFVRASTDPRHNGILPLYWDKGGDGKPFLIDEAQQDYFGEGVRNNYCVLAVTKQKTFFLWCNPLEDPDGNWNSWHSSAHDMKALAAASWLKFKSNRQLNGYEPIDPAPPILWEPEWPDMSWNDIVRLAFRRHLVEVDTHPLIVRLMGG